MSTRTRAAVPERAYRPLGLSIAILASALFYGVFPSLPLLLWVWIKITRPGYIGVDFIGGVPGQISIAMGLLTLIACIPAWLGRPPLIRWGLVILIWLETAFQIYRLILANQPEQCFNSICGGISFTGPELICSGAALIVVMLYVTWYMNRAPARAFYRR